MTVHVYSRLPALQSLCYMYTSNSQTIKPVQIYLPTAGSECGIQQPLTKFLKPYLYVVEGPIMNFRELILVERICSNIRFKCLVHKQKKKILRFLNGEKNPPQINTLLLQDKTKFTSFKLNLFWLYYLN